MEEDGPDRVRMANLAEEVQAPELEPILLKIKAVVKVFVIDAVEGFWLDCGAGDAQFIISSQVNNLNNLSPKEVGISVQNTYEEPQSRDFIEPIREKKMRSMKEDKNILLEINFEHAKEFSKCQSKYALHSNDYHLGSN